jgi:mercuric ion binding protein
MKASILTIIVFLFISIAAIAQSKSKVVTASIKVYGNCGMCKDRIEQALDHKGIKTATWDPTTKNLEVVYVPKKISEQQICDLVSAVGHDTDKSKASDEMYAKLPFCCLYRDQDHGGMQDGDHKDHDKKDH